MTRVIINGVEYAPIGKPKPLLADAQVGDLCKLRNGNYITITKAQEDAPQHTFSDNVSRNEAGCAFGIFMASFDIIHTEPLATEGTAEWALQMMKLGKKIINANSTFPFILKADRIVRCGDDVSWDIGHWLRVFDDTFGWQLYEPATKAGVPFEVAKDVNERITECLAELGCIEPEPATEPKPQPEYEVGDWVTDGFVVGKVTETRTHWIDVVDMQGIPHTLGTVKLRKLDRSEVKVKITLEGTVSKDYDETLDSFILNNADGHTRNRIKYSTIDPATAELVRELVEP